MVLKEKQISGKSQKQEPIKANNEAIIAVTVTYSPERTV